MISRQMLQIQMRSTGEYRKYGCIRRNAGNAPSAGFCTVLKDLDRINCHETCASITFPIDSRSYFDLK